jgi:uncharacterized sodium:solute symporter family permease YidK
MDGVPVGGNLSRLPVGAVMTGHVADCVCDWCLAVSRMQRDLAASRLVTKPTNQIGATNHA